MRPATLLAILLVSVSGLGLAQSPLRLVQTIALPGVSGRIDHLAIDLRGGRLFVAALGNGIVEVVDLASGRRIRSIAGLKEPQGLAFLRDRDQLVVTEGGNGRVTFFDATSCAPLRQVTLGEDADNVRVEPGARRVWVGYGSGALAAIDVDTGTVTARVPLPGHPESFQIEHGTDRIYVNVPSARAIVVVDRKSLRAVATWPLPEAHENFPMALDESQERLFVACRRPARLLVLDTASGRSVAEVEIVGDCDDVFYDGATHRIVATGGAGAISVVRQDRPDHYSVLATQPTDAGARTSLLASDSRRLYLAVPRSGAPPAEIRVFELAP